MERGVRPRPRVCSRGQRLEATSPLPTCATWMLSPRMGRWVCSISCAIAAFAAAPRGKWAVECPGSEIDVHQRLGTSLSKKKNYGLVTFPFVWCLGLVFPSSSLPLRRLQPWYLLLLFVFDPRWCLLKNRTHTAQSGISGSVDQHRCTSVQWCVQHARPRALGPLLRTCSYVLFPPAGRS
jgi:hypothetical protein